MRNNMYCSFNSHRLTNKRKYQTKVMFDTVNVCINVIRKSPGYRGAKTEHDNCVLIVSVAYFQSC